MPDWRCLVKQTKLKNIVAEPEGGDLHPSDVDAILKELLAINREEGDGDMENLNFNEFCSTRLIKGQTDIPSKEVYYVRTPVRTVLRRGRKK